MSWQCAVICVSVKGAATKLTQVHSILLSGTAARLHRQLARGRQHEHVRGAHFARAEQQPLQQRQRKRGRLTGARHRAAADVAPGQRQRDARRLRQDCSKALQHLRV